VHYSSPPTVAASAATSSPGLRFLGGVSRALVAAGWAVAALGAVILVLAGAVLAAAAAMALGTLRGGSALRARRAAHPRTARTRRTELPAVIPKRLG
jgi:hypothetical protein